MTLPATWQPAYPVSTVSQGILQPGDPAVLPEGEACASDNWLLSLDGGTVEATGEQTADGGAP